MLEPKVWREAATQVFFALGLGFGGVIAFSSYNKRDNNCHFDAVLVSFINFFTSVLATLVVFAVLGFKANIINEKCVIQYEFFFFLYISCMNKRRSLSLISLFYYVLQKFREDFKTFKNRQCEPGYDPTSYQFLKHYSRRLQFSL